MENSSFRSRRKRTRRYLSELEFGIRAVEGTHWRRFSEGHGQFPGSTSGDQTKMKQKAPLPWQGGKQASSVESINSHRNKSLLQHSNWNVNCEGCGWNAQFRTGREAGEAGWAHHKTTHHNKRTAKSMNTCDGAATPIFRQLILNGSVRAAKLKDETHQITSEVEQGAQE